MKRILITALVAVSMTGLVGCKGQSAESVDAANMTVVDDTEANESMVEAPENEQINAMPNANTTHQKKEGYSKSNY